MSHIQLHILSCLFDSHFLEFLKQCKLLFKSPKLSERFKDLKPEIFSNPFAGLPRIPALIVLKSTSIPYCHHLRSTFVSPCFPWFRIFQITRTDLIWLFNFLATASCGISFSYILNDDIFLHCGE